MLDSVRGEGSEDEGEPDGRAECADPLDQSAALAEELAAELEAARAGRGDWGLTEGGAEGSPAGGRGPGRGAHGWDADAAAAGGAVELSGDEEEDEEDEEAGAAGDEGEWGSMEEMWRSRDAAAVAAVAAAAGDWARIVRPPRKRSRHGPRAPCGG